MSAHASARRCLNCSMVKMKFCYPQFDSAELGWPVERYDAMGFGVHAYHHYICMNVCRYTDAGPQHVIVN